MYAVLYILHVTVVYTFLSSLITSTELYKLKKIGKRHHDII